MEHVLHPQPGYPFSLRISIEYALTDIGLRVRTTARILGYGRGEPKRVKAFGITCPSQRRERRSRRGRNNLSCAKCEADHIRRAAFLICPGYEMHPFGRRREVMTWSSDSTGVLLYAILATLFVMSWIYVPA